MASHHHRGIIWLLITWMNNWPIFILFIKNQIRPLEDSFVAMKQLLKCGFHCIFFVTQGFHPIKIYSFNLIGQLLWEITVGLSICLFLKILNVKCSCLVSMSQPTSAMAFVFSNWAEGTKSVQLELSFNF